jgi:nucleotide-binding universal stress UspA family protein
MRKIFVAVDGSPSSIHAARTALTIADATKGEVTLVAVVAPVVIPSDIPFPADFTEESLKAAEVMLEAAARELGRPQLRRMCLTGTPAERLCELAEEENADLLVVGSKGRGAVSRMLLGSTTDRLVHISLRPVLVVR